MSEHEKLAAEILMLFEVIFGKMEKFCEKEPLNIVNGAIMPPQADFKDSLGWAYAGFNKHLLKLRADKRMQELAQPAQESS